jgi:predicted RNase H-like HicB family nuclease
METMCVIYHRESDGWWAESPDVEGWSAAGDSCAELFKLAVEGSSFVLRRDDVSLEHIVSVRDSGAHIVFPDDRRP